MEKGTMKMKKVEQREEEEMQGEEQRQGVRCWKNAEGTMEKGSSNESRENRNGSSNAETERYIRLSVFLEKINHITRT